MDYPPRLPPPPSRVHRRRRSSRRRCPVPLRPARGVPSRARFLGRRARRHHNLRWIRIAIVHRRIKDDSASHRPRAPPEISPGHRASPRRESVRGFDGVASRMTDGGGFRMRRSKSARPRTCWACRRRSTCCFTRLRNRTRAPRMGGHERSGPRFASHGIASPPPAAAPPPSPFHSVPIVVSYSIFSPQLRSLFPLQVPCR